MPRPISSSLGAAPGSRRRPAADQWPTGRGFGDRYGGGRASPNRGCAGRPRARCPGRAGGRDLDRSADADTRDRSRLLSGLAMALHSLGDSDRVAALLAEAADIARRCGNRAALYGALVRQNTAALGRGCSASHFPERRRILDEIAMLAGDAYGAHEYLAWGFGAAAAYL